MSFSVPFSHAVDCSRKSGNHFGKTNLEKIAEQVSINY